MNTNKKHFVVDIDGCITDGKGNSIDLIKLKQLAQLIKEKELSFSLCTGRSAPYVEAICQMLGLKQWCICENGVYIYYPEADKVFYHPLICQSLLDSLSKLKQVLSSDKYKTLCKFELGKEVCLSLNPLNGNIKELFEIVVSLMGDKNLYVNHSASAVDITPKGIDKGSALRFVAKKENFKLDDVVAIGDSAGDLPFMGISGMKACPINASDEVKKVCDFISLHKSISGVLDIITTFLAR